MIVAERVRTLMAEKGLSQSELARRVGISQTAIGKLASGETYSSRHLHVVARELGTTPAYLAGEIDDPSSGAVPAATPGMIAEQLGLVLVPEVDLEYGMGGGTVVREDADSRTIPFPRAWLETLTSSPVDQLFFARGRGDSMMPTLLNGDIVLIDRSTRTVTEQDRIWAIAYGDLAAIKRVRRKGGGGFKIMSDNPLVSAEEVADDELFIVGRIVWVGRKI
jgi:phage repressor protein C with HTH and peptisase S24 domain